ncbi:MAG: CHASE2 domain-containing protein, partial [Deltaproteobacteria bacterium]
IGLDLILDRPRPGDSALAAAISTSKRVVLAVSSDKNTGHLLDGEGLYVEHLILPPSSLAEAARSMGHIAMIYDRDGVVRHLPTFISDQRRIFPAFGIAVAALAANIDRQEISLSSKGLGLGNMIIPLDQQNRLRIHYHGEPGSFPSVSAADVLTGRIPREVFRDKVVLIGVSSVGLADSWITPFASSGSMHGTEIHANIIESILNGDTLSGTPFNILPVLVIFAGVAAAIVGELAPVYFSAGMLPIGICVIWGLGAVAFLSQGMVLPVAIVAGAWAAGFVAALSLRAWSYKRDLRHQEHHLATLSTLASKPSLEHLCQLIAGLVGADRAYGLFLTPHRKIKIIWADEDSFPLPEDLTYALKDSDTLWDGDRLVTDLGRWVNMRPEWLRVPIATEHSVRGCYLLCRTMGKGFTPEERQRVSDFASHTGLLLENQELLERLQDANTGTLQLLKATIEQKSPGLLHHSMKVAEMAKRLAQEMQLHKTTVETVYQAGLLHDLGLVGLPDRIFQKTQGLKLEERAWIEAHPVL